MHPTCGIRTNRTITLLLATGALCAGLMFAPTTAWAEDALPDSGTIALSAEETQETEVVEPEALPAEDVADLTTQVEPAPAGDSQEQALPSEDMSPQDDPATPAAPLDAVTSPVEVSPTEATPTEPAPDDIPTEATNDADPSPNLVAVEMASKVSLDKKTLVLEHGKGGTQVLDAAGGKTANGTNLQTYAYNKSASQKWTFIDSGKADASGNPYYLIARFGTSQVLDVAGAKAKSGTNVQLYRRNGSDAQLWLAEPVDGDATHVTLVSKLSQKAGIRLVLDIAGGKVANKTNVRIYTSNNSAAQHFYLLDPAPSVKAADKLADGPGVYRISSPSTSYVTDVKGGSTANGANVQLYKANGTDAQRMVITEDGHGYYVVGVFGSGKVLDVKGASIIPGTNVQQYAYNGSDAQKWALRKQGSTYTLINKATGLALDLAGKAANGTNVQAGRDTGSSRQRFTLTRETTSVLQAGIYTIRSLKSTAQTFDISGGSAKDGGKLQVYKTNGSLAQRFEVVSAGSEAYRIRTAASGGWLTGNGKAQQVTQQGSSKTEDTADTWKVIWDKGGYWALQNTRTKLVLDLKGGKTANGTAVQLYASNGSAAQHFVFTKADLIKEGLYYLNSYYGGQSLDVADASNEPGANVQIYTSNKSDAQKFQIAKADGAYKISNYKSGLALSVSDVTAEKANVTQKRYKGIASQLWTPRIADGGYLKFVNVASGMAFEAQGTGKGSNVAQHSSAYNGERWKLAAAPTTKGHTTPKQAKVRVLMIGNSLTYRNKASGANPLPSTLQSLLGDAQVVASARNGAHLSDHLNATDELGKATRAKFNGGDWDYVILQEHSSTPIEAKQEYYRSIEDLCTLARKTGAKPIIYGTWAYDDKSDKGQDLLAELGLSRAEMTKQLQSAFKTASTITGAPVADVAEAFQKHQSYHSLYISDGKHQSEAGTKLAAEILKQAIDKLR